jgi:hypothetical protein
LDLVDAQVAVSAVAYVWRALLVALWALLGFFSRMLRALLWRRMASLALLLRLVLEEGE